MLIENTASSVKFELTAADCLKPGVNFNLVISFDISVRDREGLSPGVSLRCLCSNGTTSSTKDIFLYLHWGKAAKVKTSADSKQPLIDLERAANAS